jgi:hypothetical protein
MNRFSLARLARWLVLVAAFPLSGLVAWLVLGPIATPLAAVGGGAIVGLGVGAAEAWVIRVALPVRWIAASVVGLAAGSLLGFLVGGFGGLAIAGLVLALAQALAAPPLSWPWWVLLATAAWLLGWLVSLAAAIDRAQGFAVFGSSGALAFTLAVGFALAAARYRKAPA